jgi:hypothetical protein
MELALCADHRDKYVSKFTTATSNSLMTDVSGK